MTTSDLGACEWFVWDLRRSNLIDRGQLDQVVVEFLKKDPRAEPAGLAQYLVDQEVLTPFQAERLLHGKTQGLVLGPYTLMDVLGTGSMGTVYQARSKTDNRWYAVKVLPRRSMWNVRIARRQVRSFEQISHPAVVPFVDVGTAGSTHYLAWPLVEGETLESLVQKQGKLPYGLAALYALQTAEGLDACHQHDLYHGLLKPSNLMISAEGQVRILDFGIGSLLANVEGESLVDTMSTANSVTSGLDCASPECILEASNRTPAGDQYSLGCVLYYCLTGRYPFPEGTAVEKMMAHQTRQPAPIREFAPEVPEQLAAVVERLMQKAPAARYPRMAEVVEALQPLAEARTARPLEHAKNGQAARPVPAKPVAPPLDPPSVRGGAPLTLPTRQSLRGAPAPAAAPAPPTPEPRRAANPFLLDEPRKRRFSLDEKLGPVGLIVGALLAAAATWLLSLYLFHP
jgi:serine/threonine protein kinase